MSAPRLWILGASDPEMAAIEGLLRECGERYGVNPHFAYAYAQHGGARVSPGNAYRASSHRYAVDCGPAGQDETWYLVECDVPVPDCARRVVIDHHRPGDPGYGRPPSEFLPASSLGQVIAELARLGALPSGWTRPLNHCGAGTPGEWRLRGYRGVWMVGEPWKYAGEVQPGHFQGVEVPRDLVLAAAADHCLAAAYSGECPGVDPDALMHWRVASRAAHQQRSAEAVLADIERARAELRQARRVCLSCGDSEPEGYCVVHGDCAADMRGRHVPELPEASAREGQCFLADGLPDADGRTKVVCQSGSPEQIRAFLDDWAPAHGLVDLYGDPARGFAGGYLPS